MLEFTLGGGKGTARCLLQLCLFKANLQFFGYTSQKHCPMTTLQIDKSELNSLDGRYSNHQP